MKKQTEKDVDTFKFLSLSSKIDELKLTDSIFPQNQINDLIHGRLKEIIKLRSSMNLSKLDYKAKSQKDYIFSKIILSAIFLTHIHKKNFFNRKC